MSANVDPFIVVSTNVGMIKPRIGWAENVEGTE
jgi:hypothetical protein